MPSISDSLRSYLELIRLDKPTGTVLMFWPFAWGLTMAAYRQKLPLPAFAAGILVCLCAAFIIRSSACTINDLIDRNVDAGVERTKNRPLPSGRVSVVGAVMYLFAQYFIGVLFFYSTLKRPALYVALFQLLPLFIIYPILKRVTYWPQAWLGICMNFGFVTAWVSVNEPDWLVVTTAMIGCWCWTMLYDTVYACQDKSDDVKVGISSTAILFGRWTRPALVVCATLFIVMFAVSGYLNEQSPAFFIVSVGGLAIYLLWQLCNVNLEVPESCWSHFQAHGYLGWVVWSGLLFDYLDGAGVRIIRM